MILLGSASSKIIIKKLKYKFLLKTFSECEPSFNAEQKNLENSQYILYILYIHSIFLTNQTSFSNHKLNSLIKIDIF